MSMHLREHIDKIIPLTDAEFEYALSHFTLKKFKKHQFLIQEGEIVTFDFFVISGLVKASHTDEAGKQYIMQFAMEDWWISDYQAYFNQARATLTVDCIEDTEVFCLTLENREKLCADLHKIEHFLEKNQTQDISPFNKEYYLC